MKTIIKRITLVAACIVGLSSCNDFLTTEPHDFLAPETFYTNYSNCEMALAGVYSTLTKEPFYGNFYIVDHCIGNDHTYYQRGISNTNTKPMSNTNTAAYGNTFNLWNTLYTGINNANMFIENIDGADIEDAIKVRMKAEARFLRAYYHWILVQGWHEVPMRTSSFKDVNKSAMAATSHAEALKWIIAEMEACVELVDNADYDKSPSFVKKNTVMGILARVYLWSAGYPNNGGKADYEKAAFWANKVITSGKHKLNPDYEDVWKKMASDQYETTYNESIWEAEFYGSRNDGNHTLGRIGNTIGNVNAGSQYGYGFGAPTLILYDLYPENDIRRDVSICTYKVAANGTQSKLSNITTRNCGKFRREWEDLRGFTPNKNYTALNWPILRYSDVLLMHAEAENEANGPAAAVASINKVRERAGIELLPTSIDQATLRQEIRDERGRELCFEALHKFDLVRWGTYVQALTVDLKAAIEAGKADKRWNTGANYLQTPEALTVNTEAKHQFWPIPEKELAVNTLLEQNSYWK